MKNGLTKHSAAQETAQRQMITREELEQMQGAVEIVEADGCIGYYVVTQLCGQAVIWMGKRALQVDWGGYGKTWRAYKVAYGG